MEVSQAQEAPRSLNVQTMVPAPLMADLVRFLATNSIPHRASYSHVLWLILQGTHKTWSCEHFTSTEDALQYLASQGFSVAQLASAGRGPKVLRTLNAEALTAEHSVAPPPSPRAAEVRQLFQPVEPDNGQA